MIWKTKCDFCGEEFETNELGCTVCDSCLSFEDRMSLMDSNIKYWEKLNKIEYGKNLAIKFMPFYFDRGMVDRYRKYNACFNIPKEIENIAYYGSLDFQCCSLKIYDKDDNIILETTTNSYDDGTNITACVAFIEDM